MIRTRIPPPWFSAKLARKKARLYRLQRKGLLPPGDKASLRSAAQDALTKCQPRRV